MILCVHKILGSYNEGYEGEDKCINIFHLVDSFITTLSVKKHQIASLDCYHMIGIIKKTSVT
jgi:hypothetical protein